MASTPPVNIYVITTYKSTLAQSYMQSRKSGPITLLHSHPSKNYMVWLWESPEENELLHAQMQPGIVTASAPVKPGA